MLQKRIANRLFECFAIKRTDANLIADELLQIMQELLIETGSLTLQGIGTLSVKTSNKKAVKWDMDSREFVDYMAKKVTFKFQPVQTLEKEIKQLKCGEHEDKA